MGSWRNGVEEIGRFLPVPAPDAAKFLDALMSGKVPRVSGTTVFLTRSRKKVSRLVMDYAQFAGALPHNVIILSVSFESVPRVPKPSCHVVDHVAERFWHLTASFGFFEIPDLQRALREAQGLDADVDLEKVTFIGTRDHVVFKRG